MAYKNIDVARCSMEELKREIRGLKGAVENRDIRTALELQNFVLEANKRIRDEIRELQEVSELIVTEVLGVSPAQEENPMDNMRIL
jgi:hypothetical protein